MFPLPAVVFEDSMEMSITRILEWIPRKVQTHRYQPRVGVGSGRMGQAAIECLKSSLGTQNPFREKSLFPRDGDVPGLEYGHPAKYRACWSPEENFSCWEGSSWRQQCELCLWRRPCMKASLLTVRQPTCMLGLHAWGICVGPAWRENIKQQQQKQGCWNLCPT